MIVDWIIEIVDWALGLVSGLPIGDFYGILLLPYQLYNGKVWICSRFLTSKNLHLKNYVLIIFVFRNYFIKWSEEHDFTLCREVPLLEPFRHPRQSKERGKIWGEIAMSLNSIISPKFISVRDRLALLLAKYKEKMIKKNKVLASNVMMKQK